MEMLFVQCSVHARHTVNTKQDNAQTIYRLVTCVCLLWWRLYTNSKGMHLCVCVYTRMCSWRGCGAGLIFSQINPVIWLNIQPDRCYCWQAERGGMSMWGGKSSRGQVGPCFWWPCKHKTVELHYQNCCNCVFLVVQAAVGTVLPLVYIHCRDVHRTLRPCSRWVPAELGGEHTKHKDNKERKVTKQKFSHL